MSLKAYVQPITPSADVFTKDLFKGKVLFCTGGGSGICRGIVESMVRIPAHIPVNTPANDLLYA